MLTIRNFWRSAVLVWLCVGLVLLCTGCGGSMDADDERADTGPVDCKARPELCK